MNNKATIEISFYWLFVFIAGTIILSFFLFVANKSLNISKERAAIDFSRNLDSFLITALQSSDFERTFFFSNEINFKCSSTFCEFLINDKSTPFKDKIIFTPNKISDKILFITKSIDIPFRINNAIYLFPLNKKYYFVFDKEVSNNIKEILTNLIPKNLNHAFIDINDIAEIPDYNNVKFVFLNTRMPALPENSKKYSISATLLGENFVEFYLKEENSNYFKKISNKIIVPFDIPKLLLGAVVTEDPELFNKQLFELTKRINSISLIYLNRLNELPSICEGQYSDAKDILAIYVDESQKSLNDFNNYYLRIPYENLINLNNNIIKDSCPEIF